MVIQWATTKPGKVAATCMLVILQSALVCHTFNPGTRLSKAVRVNSMKSQSLGFVPPLTFVKESNSHECLYSIIKRDPQRYNSLVIRNLKGLEDYREDADEEEEEQEEEDDDDEQNEGKQSGWMVPFHRAGEKFKARPFTYCMIPVIAAFVGWLTNWLAVQMIFYPIEWKGIPIIKRSPESIVPLGLIGWQGIVPCKTRVMSDALVTMVTTQLLSVREVFQRLDPHVVARLLAPQVPDLAEEVLRESVPGKLAWIPNTALALMSPRKKLKVLTKLNERFLVGFTQQMQANIESVWSVRNCVINQMVLDKRKLGELFWKCGSKELDFLTNSGLWFGFMLGIIQMIVALFWDNPWTLSFGGLIVGYATNWLALKWIFEPVNPTKVGPFILQGKFLRRQKEVAAEFSNFFATKILNSEQVWQSILTDPSTRPNLIKLMTSHMVGFVGGVTKLVTFGLWTPMESKFRDISTNAILTKLPSRVGVLHPYIDQTLQLESTLRTAMEKMTSVQFERVLHPIFEEDELTLILAGAVLGFIAGLIQQGIETGILPRMCRNLYIRVRNMFGRKTRNDEEEDDEEED